MNNPNDTVLLTEQGKPIGELVMASDETVPAFPNDKTIEENRQDILRSNAVALTGQPDADKAVAELYPGYGDSELRKKAMVAFVTQGKSPDGIAAELGVAARTVSMWSFEGRWDELLRKEIKARHHQSLLELEKVRSQRRVKAAKEQLDQAKELRDMAMSEMRTNGVSMSKQSAWTSAAKVEQTLVGMSEAGSVTDVDGDKADAKKEDGKRPLVVVFQNGGLPPMRGDAR